MIKANRRGVTKESEGIKDTPVRNFTDIGGTPVPSPEHFIPGSSVNPLRYSAEKDGYGRPVYLNGRAILYCPHCQKSIPGYEARR